MAVHSVGEAGVVAAEAVTTMESVGNDVPIAFMQMEEVNIDSSNAETTTLPQLTDPAPLESHMTGVNGLPTSTSDPAGDGLTSTPTDITLQPDVLLIRTEDFAGLKNYAHQVKKSEMTYRFPYVNIENALKLRALINEYESIFMKGDDSEINRNTVSFGHRKES